MSLRHRILACLASLCAAAVVLGFSPQPATADTAGCVARAEYRSVSKGMTKYRVKTTFDTAGSRMSYVVSGGFTAEMRQYRTCLQYSSVVILFSNGRLDTKAATWVYV